MTREELDKRIEEARQRLEVLSQAGVPKRSVGMSVSEVRNARPEGERPAASFACKTR